MTIYLDEPFATVWIEDDIPCVFCTLKGTLDKTQLDSLAKIEMMCVKKLKRKHTEVYSLVNMQGMSFMEKSIVRYMNRTVRGQFHSGLTHKLLVSPTDKSTRISLLDALNLYQDMKIDVFNTLEGAMDVIKMHSAYQQYSVSSRKSILRMILEPLGFNIEESFKKKSA